jgi:hypothetical protein
MTTPQPNSEPDHIEWAIALFLHAPPLEQLVADLAPLDPSEHFDLPDVSDEEWEVFERALAE